MEIIASGGYDTEVSIWDLSSGEKIALLESHSGSIFCVCFSPCGSLLATGSDDHTVKLWDCHSWTVVQTFIHSSSGINLDFNTSSDRIVSTSMDQTVRVWSLITNMEELKIEMQRGDMSMSFGMTGPPQLDRGNAGEVCFSHIQGLFSLITTTDFRNPEQIRLLPQDQFIWYDMYTHQDWGNPQAVELAHRVRYWECLANIESADGYFKATMRCSEAGWFWALEWNKQLRLVGGIGKGPMQVFGHLPSEEWMPTPKGRMRRQVPLDPATDILFAGVVQPA